VEHSSCFSAWLAEVSDMGFQIFYIICATIGAFVPSKYFVAQMTSFYFDLVVFKNKVDVMRRAMPTTKSSTHF
jgi:hypothetical protein